MKFTSTYLVCAASCALFSMSAFAGDHDHDHGHRSAEAHEHGHSSLNMAIEGNTIELELVAPGADIVGFEYVAKSKEDKAKLEKATAKLKDVFSWMKIKGDAGCAVTKAAVEFETEEQHSAHGKDDHAHGHHDDHGHDKEKKAKKDDYDHGHDHHGHGDDKKAAEAAAEHAVFHATYKLTCEKTKQISGIAFDYFKSFAGAEELEVNLVTAKKQTKFEVTRDKPEIDLVGTI